MERSSNNLPGTLEDALFERNHLDDQLADRITFLYREKDSEGHSRSVYGDRWQHPTLIDRIMKLFPHQTIDVDGKRWHKLPSGWIQL